VLGPRNRLLAILLPIVEAVMVTVPFLSSQSGRQGVVAGDWHPARRLRQRGSHSGRRKQIGRGTRLLLTSRAIRAAGVEERRSRAEVRVYHG
jgi:hypothetical protein